MVKHEQITIHGGHKIPKLTKKWERILVDAYDSKSKNEDRFSSDPAADQ